MPTPPNFSAWRHLHNTLIILHNRRVRTWFKDIPDPDKSTETARKSVRSASLIEPDDSALIAFLRIYLFDSFISGLWGGGGSGGDVYGVPVTDFHERVQFKPQIMLLFRQPLNEVPTGERAIEAQIAFRIDDAPESITEAELRSYARKIDTLFGTKQTPYKFSRGRIKVNYFDPDRGYRLQILAQSVAEGKQVIGRVLSVRGHALDPNLLTVSEAPSRSFRTGNEVKFIAGRSRNLPRERPIGNVEFYRAELKVWGVRPDITLVDYLGRRADWLNRN